MDLAARSDRNFKSAALVFRFRSSHHFAAPSSAHFGIKGTLAISILSSAAYGFEVPTRDCRELIRNFKSAALGRVGRRPEVLLEERQRAAPGEIGRRLVV